MNIHEFQAKELLKRYHIPVPEYVVIRHQDDLLDVDYSEAVVKIQVHAGGRGKAGGVKFAKSPAEIKEQVKRLLGMKMVNNQTGPQGVIAHSVILSKPVDIHKEYYLGAIIDRAAKQMTLIASTEGGMDIEEVAEKHPEKILTLPILPGGKLRLYQVVAFNKFMGFKGEVAKQAAKLVQNLAKAFYELDASILEINPLVLTPDHQLIALDAKFAIDDNALFRHPDILKMRDPSQSSEAENAAFDNDLSYVSLDGNIGCMVNGAGLAMATMDIIQHEGGKPANFLDVGGSATKDRIAFGFEMILSDPQVKGILVNIFGGIVSCKMIAEGIIQVVKERNIRMPIVVRLEGTHVKEGEKLLEDSGLEIVAAVDLLDAAKKIVAEVQEVM
ncbi:MAG: ADP-forming succinate--CoA ligase subunit beta [Chlamydiia bacterium]